MELVIVGSGNLARALATGWTAESEAPALGVRILARSTRYLDASWPAAVADRVTLDPESITGANLVILAVKPKDMESAAKVVASVLPDGIPVVSVAAGIPLSRLAQWLPGRPLARAMPNVAGQVKDAVTALAFPDRVATRERQLMIGLFDRMGWTTVVEEADLDAITALSGSGPAYAFLVMEAIAAAGMALGLSKSLARELAARTFRGAASVALTSPERAFPDLIRDVASPGGTTEAALGVLKEKAVPDAIRDALTAAAKRANSIAKE